MRFFFHFFHNGHQLTDDTGTELPDVQRARKEALSALCGVAADQVDRLTAGHEIALRIEAEGQQLGILRLTFDEVPPDWAKRPAKQPRRA